MYSVHSEGTQARSNGTPDPGDELLQGRGTHSNYPISIHLTSSIPMLEVKLLNRSKAKIQSKSRSPALLSHSQHSHCDPQNIGIIPNKLLLTPSSNGAILQFGRKAESQQQIADYITRYDANYPRTP